MTASLSLIISISQLTILSSVAVAGGLYFLFFGIQLLARKRLLLATPTSRIGSAAVGLVEVTGEAAGPFTLPAPITGQVCFLYHTTAWQQRNGGNQEWEKVAEETLHLPFFIADGNGQLLVEPLGADLDLNGAFREEYDASLISSNPNSVPPRVSVFLARHSIVPSRRLRVEERLIKPEDALFVTGTLMENPGVQLRPYEPRSDASANLRPSGGRRSTSQNLSKPMPAPEIIQLSSGVPPSSTREMSQQAKIAAALTRAGIRKPEAWSAAGIPYQNVAVEENEAPSPVSSRDDVEHKPSGFDLTPPVVLIKGANDARFVISFRSQKEFVSKLAWKCAALIYGGAAITLLGLYVLLGQMGLL